MWLARELRGKLSVRETAERDDWLAQDVENAVALKRARATHAGAGAAASHPEMLAMREAALAATPALRSGWKRLAPLGALAIAACAMFALVWANLAPSTLGPGNGEIEALEAARTHYTTRIGERLSATLDDGSVVTLNTDSEVRIDYTQATRRIELVRGQALFAVAHRPNWPFLVEAGGQAVRALGTEFEVRLNGSNLEVTLLEGRVAVGRSAELQRGNLSRAAEVEAGERLVSARGEVQIAAINTDNATSWRRGRVSFDETPLPEAIAEINRYRSAEIVINDPRVASLRISGTYRTADAMAFENMLVEALPVTEVDGARNQVELVWRDND
ncbi:MAG TPA: FecR domain-containing protein [Verrucomicrobiae bacterium]|nr:FecR domain-containing protein [Verrucomicrobiae bacterium]